MVAQRSYYKIIVWQDVGQMIGGTFMSTGTYSLRIILDIVIIQLTIESVLSIATCICIILMVALVTTLRKYRICTST